MSNRGSISQVTSLHCVMAILRRLSDKNRTSLNIIDLSLCIGLGFFLLVHAVRTHGKVGVWTQHE